MSVYNDMAYNVGYPFGTEQNRQMAQLIEQDHMQQLEDMALEEYKIFRYYRNTKMYQCTKYKHMWE